ncbi:NAD-binding protein (plasmid) [Rossellomorea sp. AcN35-11]|nr:NAD-binding protein [Rossellomorea sp. AcN35-11]
MHLLKKWLKICTKSYNKALKMKYRTLALITFLFILANTLVMNYLEPGTFEHPFHIVWWLMTTMTTVGYGDVSPTTEIGQLWTMLIVYPFGIGLFGVVIGQIVESFVTHKKLKEEGKLMFKGENHYVVIGWTSKSKETIKELLCGNDDTKVVLIDELEKTPIENQNVHYINGNPTDYNVLKRAKMEEAKAVLIFAQDSIPNKDLVDGKTLLIASTIENFDEKTEEDIYTIVEILDEKHVKNFKHIKVDEFVLSEQTISHLMAKTAKHSGATHLFTQLLSSQEGNDDSDLFEISVKEHWKTYHDAYEELKSAGALLVADGKDMNIVQKLNNRIPNDAQLYVICNKDVYNSLNEY